MPDNIFVNRVTATSESIKNQIEEHIKNSLQALNEYVWNSIDANAQRINITAEVFGKTSKKIIIEDDGEGINYDKLQVDLFAHTNDSPKKKMKKDHLSLPHGRNGYGRFAFIKFANKATWKSVYLNGSGFKEFETYIHSSNLVDFKGIKASESNKNQTGTTLVISDFNIDQDLLVDKNSISKIKSSLLKEFYWVIKLKSLNITLNGKKIDTNSIQDEHTKKVTLDKEIFEIILVRWKEPYCRESNNHYLNSKGAEIYKSKTAISSLDNRFLHTVLVKSKLFDRFSPASEIERRKKKEGPLIDKNEFDLFNKLKDVTNKFSDEIRRKYSEDFVKKKIESFESKNYFDKVISSRDERAYKKIPVVEVTKEVLRFAPKVFADLNEEQTLVFLNIINKLLDDDSKTLLDILKILIKPGNEAALEELRKLLEKYPLSNIVSAIKLIEDRLITLDKLKEMVYSDKYYFLESDLQREIENHFWIFGEEYSDLIGSEEDDFNRLYEEYCKYNKIESKKNKRDLSKKQVDLFVSGKSNDGKLETNLIVEIKRPKLNEGSAGYIRLGLTNYNQLEAYSEIIRKMPIFNSPKTKEWNYFLVGADLDDSFSYEDRNRSLMKTKHEYNIKLYALSWTELLDKAKFRLEYIRKHLEGKKKRIIERSQSKEEISEGLNNTAKMSEVD